MIRLILPFVIFLSGCAYWQAGLNDPEIVGNAIHQAKIYKSLADVTGIPYAGEATAAGVLGILILWSGYKKVKKK